jgi:hypothetical protein
MVLFTEFYRKPISGPDNTFPFFLPPEWAYRLFVGSEWTALHILPCFYDYIRNTNIFRLYNLT